MILESYKLIFLKRDVFILVIPHLIDQSFLQRGDGSSQISATINAPDNRYAYEAAHALVNGELHVFGGRYGNYEVQFCLTKQNYEIGENSIIEFKEVVDIIFIRRIF